MPDFRNMVSFLLTRLLKPLFNNILLGRYIDIPDKDIDVSGLSPSFKEAESRSPNKYNLLSPSPTYALIHSIYFNSYYSYSFPTEMTTYPFRTPSPSPPSGQALNHPIPDGVFEFFRRN